MPKYLMWLCKNRDKDSCDEAIKAVGNIYPEPDGPFVNIARYGDVQEALDEKCESCPQGLFEMENDRCPVCHDDSGFKRSKPEKANLGLESKPEWFYLFSCEEGHNLCNKKDLLG
jgi:hypothetical protein